MHPPIGPILVQLGPLSIHWYGVTMATAIIVGTLIAARYVERFGFSGETILNLLLWVLIPAIVGARLYFVFIQTPWTATGVGRYLAHPLDILAISKGGIHIYGAFIFGGVALLLYVWRKGLPLPIYLDAAALALPLSQAIGRIGNFINQELYGPPTTLPWGLRIDDAQRVAPYDDLIKYPESTRFQPLFLYEMLWNLLGFSLLFYISRRFAKRLQPGDLVLLYFIWYPLGRFWLEFFRTDSWFFHGVAIPFNTVHLLSLLAIAASSLTLYARHRRAPARPDWLSRLGAVLLTRYEHLRDAVRGSQPLLAPTLAVAGVTPRATPGASASTRVATANAARRASAAPATKRAAQPGAARRGKKKRATVSAGGARRATGRR